MNRHPLAPLFLALALLALPACGEQSRATTTGREQVVERERTRGTYGGEAVDLTRERTQETRTASTTEGERQVITPEVPPLLTQLAGAAAPLIPGGGFLAGVLGLGAAWLASRKTAQAERQRDEVVDGVSRAREVLPPDQWPAIKLAMQAEQSRDTQAVVRSRTGKTR